MVKAFEFEDAASIIEQDAVPSGGVLKSWCFLCKCNSKGFLEKCQEIKISTLLDTVECGFAGGLKSV